MTGYYLVSVVVVAAIIIVGHFWLTHRRHTGAGRAWAEEGGQPGSEGC